MVDMFAIMLTLQLSEEIYPAALAELEYTINTAERGFVLKVNGYNEKLPVSKMLDDNLLLDGDSSYSVLKSEFSS